MSDTTLRLTDQKVLSHTDYLALALSFVVLNIYVHICWLDTQGKAIVYREWKESLAASNVSNSFYNDCHYQL